MNTRLSLGVAILFILFFSLTIFAASPIPTDRSIDWSKAGIPGGIPNRAVCQTISAGASQNTIQIALNSSACQNKAVLLSAGTYNITSSLTVPSNVTLRGSGPKQTILNATGSELAVIILGSSVSPDISDSVSITGGSSTGSNVLTLSNTSGITVGSYLEITELNSGYVNSLGSEGQCGWCDQWDGTRALGQIVEVTSVNGNTVGISPGLYTNYTHTPLATPFNAGAKYAGVEDLQVYANNTGYVANFRMEGTAYSWIKNVEGNYADGDHVQVFFSYRGEIRDSYFHDAYSHTPGHTDADVFIANKTSAFLVENNILRRLHASIMLNWGAAGNVIAYNYMQAGYSSNAGWAVGGGIGMHGAHPQFNLIESNIGPSINQDSIWGSSGNNTIYRNWFQATTKVCNNPGISEDGTVPDGVRTVEPTSPCWWGMQSARAIELSYLASNGNILGNVLGSYDVLNNATSYNPYGSEKIPMVAIAVPPQEPSYDGASYGLVFGFSSTTWDATTSTIPYSTALLHGNYNYANSSTSWDPTISTHTLPASLYLSAKPTWWGNTPWPAIGPDVTNGNGDTSGHANKIPAQIRFEAGMPTCTSFTYSSWSTCTNGNQSRTVTTSLPSGCSGGIPVTTQPCSTEPTCGNGIVEMGEVCDASNVNNLTCSTVAAGFASGNLNCNADCKSYNTTQCVSGKTIHPTSCSREAVQEAIDYANNGDIIQVPAGNCTWTTDVLVPKSVYIKGAGPTETIITVGNNNGAFAANMLNGSLRISGFGFRGNTQWAYLSIDGTYKSLRIDHIDFEDIPGIRGIMLGSSTQYNNLPGITGVFDHLNVSTQNAKIFIAVYGNSNSWESPDNYGTNDFIFIEDTNITSTSNPPWLDLADGECGARMVVRNNILTNTGFAYHDTGSTPGCRSTRVVEVYNNLFNSTVTDSGWSAISFRGGTGVYYNNTIYSYPNGFENGAATQLYRSYGPGGTPWNTVCDSTPDRICSDFKSHCNAGDHKACGGDWDCSVGECTINQCTTDAQCGAGATCLAQTDGHQDSTGWPCRDQTGTGQDAPVTHIQASSPSYWWNNKDQTGNDMSVIINDHGVPNFSFIQKGRDYFEGIQKPNYAAYPYPHPLTLIEPQVTEPPVTCTTFTYTNWSTCANGTQTRSVLTSSPTGCSGGTPITAQPCIIIPPTCTAFTYSDWSTCTNGTQTRTILDSAPTGCTGGNPITTQTCGEITTCGNGIVDAGEACDGSNVNGLTCSTVAAGLKSGTLSCASDCKSYNTSSCIAGNTINVTTTSGQPSCAEADVQRAIDNASDGDIIQMPAKNCNWGGVPRYGISDSYLLIDNKNITLKGAGIDSTIITRTNVGDNSDNKNTIVIEGSKPFRITNFTLKSSLTLDSAGIAVGTSGNWRIDHMKIANFPYGFTAIPVYGITSGLIDHINFWNNASDQVDVGGSVSGDVYDGDTVWDLPLSLGTKNAVIIEDNIITRNDPVLKTTSFGEDIAANRGGRYVARHNTIIYDLDDVWLDPFDAHGNCNSQARGTRSWEIYDNNVIVNGNAGTNLRGFYIRGGDGVVFNNTFTLGPDVQGGAFVMTDQRENTDTCNFCAAYRTYSAGCAGANKYPLPDQIRSAYFWNNTKNGAPMLPDIQNDQYDATYIVEGRDYFNYEKPGYVSYPYPHPLTLIEPTGTTPSITTSPIPADRSIDWSKAGVEGDIPNRTNICATLSPGATGTQINTAIAACNNGVVKLNAGTYNISDIGIIIEKSNVTLRGAGAENTILNFSADSACGGLWADVCFTGTRPYETPEGVWNWTAGYTKDTNVITLSSTPTGLSVGDMLILDQADDTADTGGIYVSSAAENGTSAVSIEGCTDFCGRGGVRAQQQHVKVIAINGNKVTISPGIYMTNWRAANNPQAFWYGPSIEMSGIEDLTMDHTNGGVYGIAFTNAYTGWVKNVRSLNSNRAQIDLVHTAHIEIRDSYFYGTQRQESQSYGIETYGTSDALVENNIFEHITTPTMSGPGNQGNVYGYNYMIDMPYYNPIWMMASMSGGHTAGSAMNLYESNIGNGFWMDTFHGSSALITTFRNRLFGWETGKTAGTSAVGIWSYNRLVNIVGNILGTSGYHTNYEDSQTASGITGDPDNSIYVLGFAASGEQAPYENPYGGTVQYDPKVVSTLLRWGNFDYATNTTRWNASELPSGVAVPTTQTLPNSLYLSERPAFYKGTNWPSIDPSSPSTATNPAKECYTSNTENPVNMITCLGQTTAGPTCTSFTYSAWSTCFEGNQTRTILTQTPSGCSGGNPVLTQTCTSPTCTSFTYGNWGTCVGGTQSRTATGTPVGCVNGNPITTQTCVVIPNDSIGINVGGSEYTATDGTIYQADNYYNTGANFVYGTAGDIAGTTDDALYQTERWADEKITYNIPVTNGTYDVTLKFAEIYWNSSNTRVFNVDIEGVRKITNLDIYAQVGANTAYDQTFTTTINDGTVTIDLLYTGVDSPKVNAIKIAKQTTPTCTTFTYSNWGACSGGNQSRTVTSSLPTGCSGGNPITTQTCTTQTCTAFTYSNWGTCTNGNQTRTVLTSTPSGCVGGNPVLTQTCTSTCTSFTYSNWNTCSNGTQSRTVTSSLPTGCSGGNPITTQTCTVSAGGLVAKYTFSGNMLDSSGNNHNGLCTGTGCPTLTTDKDSVANNAYDFSNNYINLGDLDLSGNFTLSFWMKPDTFPTTYASTIMKAYDYGCELNHGNTLTCYVGDNGYWTATTNITGLTANTWYYITLTYDGTTLKLYKNANLTNTDTGTHSTTDYALLIGSWNQSIEYFDGKMDEIKIYDKVLTQTEINQEYTITPTCTSFTYSNWGACSGGNQSRTVTSSIPSGCSGGNPVLTQTCTETCTSFTYSAWSTCTNGTQSRTVTSSLPNGCAGGNPITTQTCTTPTQGLIAQYTFSGNMQDSIGSNNGTCSGTRCPTLTTDKDNTANKAYEFSEDYIDLGDLDLDGNFTLSFWMKPNSFPSSGAYRSTVMKAYDYGCELNQGTKISCYVSNNGYSWSATASATGLVANNWYHVAMTYEGRTLKLYLNSVLKKTVTGRHTTQDSSLLVGSWRDEMEFFDGTLDEIRIYDRPLTQEEITALYQ